MKYIIFLIAMLMTMFVHADQRFETWQGLCHFAYDPNDDDNEVYFANCKNTIDTYDAADGQGRLGFGKSTTNQTYLKRKDTYPKQLEDGNIKLKGADSTVGNAYTEAANTNCVMVTSNYDAGNDDNNETVYTTNDWELEISVSDRNEDGTLPESFRVRYNLNCRNANAQ